jgi:hypothetical protein
MLRFYTILKLFIQGTIDKSKDKVKLQETYNFSIKLYYHSSCFQLKQTVLRNMTKTNTVKLLFLF